MTDARARIYVAKISDLAGQQLSAEFVKLTDAIRWASILKLGDRAHIYLNGALIWTKSFPNVLDPETIAAEAEALLAKLASDTQPGD
jgi:hypothetical protein